MRVSTAQMLNIDALTNRQNQLAKVQQQLSSGLKITSPADDPTASVRVLDLESLIAKTNQYQRNISAASGRLNIEESALAISDNTLGRAKELTIRGMNASLNAIDRQSIKVEVDQLIEEMAGVANTQNSNGEFIFSGDLSTVPAFVKNTATGEYAYQGGPQQRVLQISPTRQIADGDLGFNVFENIDSVSPSANGKRSIFNTLKALSEGLAATFKTTPGEITGTRFLRYGLDYSGATTQFNLVANADVSPATVPPTSVILPPVNLDLSGQNFTDVGGIVTFINSKLALAAIPAGFVAPNTNLPVGSNYSAAIQARSNGNRIEFVSVATTGATSSIAINNTAGTFLTDAGFTDGQSVNGSDAQTFQKQLSDVLTDIDSAQNSILKATTSIGIRLNVLDNQKSQNEKFVLDTKSTLSETQDLDYVDAASRLQLQTTALQAAQATFAKIKDLSLFNYL
jgi:flagellar hook-associated protein 3 FlgL